MTHSSSQNGTTLIELLVAVSIFTILLVMVSGIFSRFVTMERRDISERALQEDVRFSLELFTREVRTGYASTYAPGNSSGDMLIFRNQNDVCVAYRLQEAALQRAEVQTSNTCDTAPFQNFVSLTSQKTTVQNLQFHLREGVVSSSGGEPPTLANQGFVTITMRARSINTSIPPLDVQTTVTSRQVLFKQ